MIDEYVVSEGRKLRMGITTGTCAALAAQGAVRMLLSGREVKEACLVTPKGIRVTEPLLDISISDGAASCAVRKDAGDDKDATDGILIYARASIPDAEVSESPTGPMSIKSANSAERISDKSANAAELISITGGTGIGRVTLPGLDQPVGAAAINSVPRKMIREAVTDAANALGYDGPIEITVYAPEGRKIAEKTFNPRLGIRGGISILGTEGIVRPMSRRALTDTIRADIRVHAQGGCPVLAVPGNYGLRFLEETFGVPASDPVIMSNYVGETIDAAGEAGVKELLLAGHLGKFVKLAGGIMNTHSSEADARMELLCAHAVRCGAPADLLKQILDCTVTQEAAQLLKAAGLLKAVSGSILRAAEAHVRRRAAEGMKTALIIYTLEDGILAESTEARPMLARRAKQMPETGAEG